MKKYITGLAALLAVVVIFSFTTYSPTPTSSPAPDYSAFKIDWSNNGEFNASTSPYDYFEIDIQIYSGLELDPPDGEYNWENKMYLDEEGEVTIKVVPKVGDPWYLYFYEQDLHPTPYGVQQDEHVYQYNVLYEEIEPAPKQ